MKILKILVAVYMVVTTILACLFLVSLPVNRLYESFHEVRPGATRSEVLSILGKPERVYPPEQIDRAYSGFYPKPRIRPKGEIWVYTWWYVRRFVIHFDEQGRVQCTVVVRT